MTHLPYDICLRLRQAGLPQPEKLENGQRWYMRLHEIHASHPFIVHGCNLVHEYATHPIYTFRYEKGVNTWPISIITHNQEALKEDITPLEMLYCPDAEYLLDHLDSGLQITKHWTGIENVWTLSLPATINLAEGVEDDIIFRALTLLEVSALAYLHLHEKPTPLP